MSISVIVYDAVVMYFQFCNRSDQIDHCHVLYSILGIHLHACVNLHSLSNLLFSFLITLNMEQPNRGPHVFDATGRCIHCRKLDEAIISSNNDMIPPYCPSHGLPIVAPPAQGRARVI